MVNFKRSLLSGAAQQVVVVGLQQCLVDSIDLALQLKQAHWAVVGNNFRNVHLQLDEILIDVRNASDELAERIATLGVTPDGRAQSVAEHTRLASLSNQFESTANIVTAIADRLQTVIQGLREAMAEIADHDPVSEDLLIGIAAPLEKHLWMMQSQEL